MIFSSIVFLLYFLPLALLLYYFVPNKAKNIFLLACSAFFYAWGAPKFIFVILITTIFDFLIVHAIEKQNRETVRKILFVFSISVNTGLLFYFKYLNFFIDNINVFLDKNGYESWPLLDIVLPIGISFYTFESITYVVDVYLKKHKPLTNFVDYQLYILLFPKLIAGPIIRYSDIADQITNRFDLYNAEFIVRGFRRFVIGLAKKVIIANTVGEIADEVFNSPSGLLNTCDYWIGMLSYTFQLYFDFSGYSDIAIGIATMLGFKFPENFNNPYNAISITDFWRRWHISLGNWMKNYLYIPLGGNQVSNIRLYFNLWLVFILSGFWHGANWTFIAWGVYHGFFLVIERVGLNKLQSSLPKIITVVFTFFIVSIGWVLFRADTIEKAFTFIQNLFDFSIHHNRSSLEISVHYCFIFTLAVIFSFIGLLPITNKVYNHCFNTNINLSLSVFYTIISFVLFFICISYIAITNFNPFIYFRF